MSTRGTAPFAAWVLGTITRRDQPAEDVLRAIADRASAELARPTAPPDDLELLSVEQVARLLHRRTAGVSDLVKRGTIKSVKVGGFGPRRVPRWALREYQERAAAGRWPRP